MTKSLEVRFTENPGLQAESGTSGKTHTGPTLRGYAAVFHSRSENLGGFVEVVAPGAFAASLKSRDVRALYHHDSAAILGRMRNNSLRLWEDRHGLAFELSLPPTQLGQDVAALVSRGDVSKMSFGFICPEGGDSWTRENGLTVRTLKTVDLLEVSLVGEPAYRQTSVALRKILAAAVEEL